MVRMKTFALYLLVVVVYLSLRSSLLGDLPAPNLSLIIVFYIAAQKGSFEGAVFSFILGYIEDVFSGGIIGMTSLSLVVVFMAAHYLSRRVELNTATAKMLGVCFISLLQGILTCIVLYFFLDTMPAVTPLFLTLIVTGVLTPPLIGIIARIDLFVFERQQESRVL